MSLLQPTTSKRVLLALPGVPFPEPLRVLLGDGSPQADLLKNFLQGDALVAPVQQAEDSEHDGVPGRDKVGVLRLHE